MYVIFDLGYLMFYRYHATARWIAFQKDVQTSPDVVLATCRAHLVSQMDKLRKRYRGARFVFCKDERHDCVWRKEVYPEYKMNRPSCDPVISSVSQMVDEVVAKYGTILRGDRLEADDIAYLLVQKIRAELPDEPIILVTSDRDYLQMLDTNIIIIDGRGKEIKGSGDANVDLWTKIIMGDKSDNIPPIYKGCGKKTADVLARDADALRAFVEKNGCHEALARNELLVRMSKIPQHLVDACSPIKEFVVCVHKP